MNGDQERHDQAGADDESSVRRLEESILTRLQVRRELWEIRRLQLRVFVLLGTLIGMIVSGVMYLIG